MLIALELAVISPYCLFDVILGLDPKWEETYTFDITDEDNTKCSAHFIMGSEETRKQV